MLNQLLDDDLSQALLNVLNSPYWARAKKLLAIMLGLSAAELTKLLESGSPLTDAEIAARLGVTTQQAQNYRKAARARLLRHLKTYGSRKTLGSDGTYSELPQS